MANKMMALAMLATGVAAPIVLAPATAQAPAVSGYSVETTSLGTLLDDPAAKAVLQKHVSALIGNAQIEMARPMTLKQMQQFAGDLLTDDTLSKIQADLAKLPAKSASAGIVPKASPGIAQPPAPAKALYSPDGDKLFAEPYVDIDEWRDAPVRHRYVHGGFKGTETRFSFYFPEKAQYRGHFYQFITPVPDSENITQKMPADDNNMISIAVNSGGYFIETNGGGKFDLGKIATSNMDPTISAYRANAASAAYSRVLAQKMYGGGRPYGFAFGGSGGAYRTIGSFENTRGVWDGVAPFVMGSNMAIPNMFTVRMRAMRILWDKFPQILDAVSPGGSGDPYAGLTPIEAGALREVTRMGFPPQSWFGYKTMGVHGFSALYQGVLMADPTYFTDFWTKPGYLGHDHPEEFQGARMQFETNVGGILTAADAARARINIDASNEQERGGVDTAFKIPEGAEGQRVAAFKLTGTPPPIHFFGGDLFVLSGAAKGQRLSIARIVGDVAVLGFADSAITAKLAPGDQVRVDNSNFLAAETYHRHQVPDASYKTWDQFRKADGTPLYPQRSQLIGPGFVMATGGSLQTGKWTGKMIVVEALWDREAMPWQADWYRGLVRENLGATADQHYRLYYIDHALHGGVEDETRTVNYAGALVQALRDLSDWVKNGIEPPASTVYRVDDGQVIVPATAAERKGVQPVVTLKVNGGERADVKVGSPVTFTGTIEVPPGGGTVSTAEWDFDGSGYATTSPIKKGAETATVTVTHSFTKPGTYYPALRGTSYRDKDPRLPHARVQNLGRVRVVVQ